MTLVLARRHSALIARFAIAIVGAAAVGAIAVAASGHGPLSTLSAVWTAAAGSKLAIYSSLVEATPISLAGLGVALAFRAGLFNLGGDGQIYAGALSGVLVALNLPHLSAFLLVPAVLIAGTLGGLVWGAIAGALRAWAGLSEIITTIMLNFIILDLVSYLVRGPIQVKTGDLYPYTPLVSSSARLGALGTTIPVGMVICVGAAVAVWIVLERSRAGLRIKELGESRTAANFAGMRVNAYTFCVLAASGALAGLAGVIDLTGDQYRLSDTFTPNWGFTAVALALIGRGTAVGTLSAGLVFGGLTAGINGAQATVGIPDSVAEIIQAAMVLFLMAANSDIIVQALRVAGVRRPGRVRARPA